MGGSCSVSKACTVRHAQGTPVTSTSDYDVKAPHNRGDDSEAQVRVLIFALDYSRTSNPLTCSLDGRNMEALAAACGAQHVQALYNEECTRQNAENTLRATCKGCGPDDFFVFYYSGHGTFVADVSGEEEFGEDEAFCFVTPQGQITLESLMTDDDFADIIIQNLPSTVRLVVLTDCCHSGTIADLTKEGWLNRHAICLSGCRADETSGDIGIGGIFTHSMLLAIEKLGKYGDYSVGELYNSTIKQDDSVFHSAQNVQIHCSDAVAPNQMAWPLVPIGPYESPLRRATKQAKRNMQTGASTPTREGFRSVDIGSYHDVPEDLVEWAKANNIDLGEDYSDLELESGWKKGQALLHGNGPAR